MGQMRSCWWERDKLHPFLFTHLWWHLALLQVREIDDEYCGTGVNAGGGGGSAETEYRRGERGCCKGGAAGGIEISCTRSCSRICGGIWHCFR
jgi:hypothetical protein